jgi:hypothetical protein
MNKRYDCCKCKRSFNGKPKHTVTASGSRKLSYCSDDCLTKDRAKK